MSRKEQIIKEIMDAMDELKRLEPEYSGSLFVHGDAFTDQSSICLKGNAEILSAAFLSQMTNNGKFNRVIMSMFGSYLANNPEEKEKLIKGMSVLDLFPINPN